MQYPNDTIHSILHQLINESICWFIALHRWIKFFILQHYNVKNKRIVPNFSEFCTDTKIIIKLSLQFSNQNTPFKNVKFTRRSLGSEWNLCCRHHRRCCRRRLRIPEDSGSEKLDLAEPSNAFLEYPSFRSSVSSYCFSLGFSLYQQSSPSLLSLNLSLYIRSEKMEVLKFRELKNSEILKNARVWQRLYESSIVELKMHPASPFDTFPNLGIEEVGEYSTVWIGSCGEAIYDGSVPRQPCSFVVILIWYFQGSAIAVGRSIKPTTKDGPQISNCFCVWQAKLLSKYDNSFVVNFLKLFLL